MAITANNKTRIGENVWKCNRDDDFVISCRFWQLFTKVENNLGQFHYFKMFRNCPKQNATEQFSNLTFLRILNCRESFAGTKLSWWISFCVSFFRLLPNEGNFFQSSRDSNRGQQTSVQECWPLGNTFDIRQHFHSWSGANVQTDISAIVLQDNSVRLLQDISYMVQPYIEPSDLS